MVNSIFCTGGRVWFYKMMETRKCFINIDCGGVSGNSYSSGNPKYACLRLDDMKAFIRIDKLYPKQKQTINQRVI